MDEHADHDTTTSSNTEAQLRDTILADAGIFDPELELFIDLGINVLEG